MFLSQPPIPPAPLLLHLGVTAQTHAIPDYARLFGDLDHFHIDWQSLAQGALPPGTGGEARAPSSGLGGKRRRWQRVC